MDQDTIDRLQCQYFLSKLATVDANKLQEAARRVKRTTSTIRVNDQPRERQHLGKRNREAS